MLWIESYTENCTVHKILKVIVKFKIYPAVPGTGTNFITHCSILIYPKNSICSARAAFNSNGRRANNGNKCTRCKQKILICKILYERS